MPVITISVREWTDSCTEKHIPNVTTHFQSVPSSQGTIYLLNSTKQKKKKKKKKCKHYNDHKGVNTLKHIRASAGLTFNRVHLLTIIS